MSTFVKTTNVTPEVLDVYKAISKKQEKANLDASFSVLQFKAIKPEGVVAALQAIKYDDKMTRELAPIIAGFPFLDADGSVKLFTRYIINEQNLNSLTYFCLAVRKYKLKEETVCDYVTATFGQQNRATRDDTRAAGGSGLTKISLGLSSLTSMVQGVGLKILTMAGSAVAEFVGEYFTKTATSPPASITFSTILEASFVYELVQRGYAEIDENERALSLTVD